MLDSFGRRKALDGTFKSKSTSSIISPVLKSFSRERRTRTLTQPEPQNTESKLHGDLNNNFSRHDSNVESSDSSNSSPRSSSNTSSSDGEAEWISKPTVKSQSTSTLNSLNSAASSVTIDSFCQGQPRKVNETHKKGIELCISLQEDAIFLPDVNKIRRRRRRYEHHESESENEDNEEEILDQSEPNVVNCIHDIQTGGSKETKREALMPCSTLRGSVVLKVNKPAKIKEVGISFTCLSKTLWNILPPSSILVDSTIPNTTQIEDVAYLGCHHWDFIPLEKFAPAQQSFNKSNQDQSATLVGQDLYGADLAILHSDPQKVVHRKYSRVYNDDACRLRNIADSSHSGVPVLSLMRTRPRKLKQNSVQSDGVLFPAGEYIYNFTLLVDADLPASICAQNGEVKYQLLARVVRSGPFVQNLTGKVDVNVVRAPHNGGPLFDSVPHDSIVLSRIWEQSLVYILNVSHRSIALDDPTNVTLTLMPLNDKDICVHRIQIWATEHVSYTYSLDQSIKYSDPVKRLLLVENVAEKNKGDRKSHNGNLLTSDETKFEIDIEIPSKYSYTQTNQPKFFKKQEYFEADARGPYIKIKHRLQVVVSVSIPKPQTGKAAPSRNYYDLDFETPIYVMSRHCTSSNIMLPSYASHIIPENPTVDPPSFDDAMTHKLLGESRANVKGVKAEIGI